jgi:hypothetical protein
MWQICWISMPPAKACIAQLHCVSFKLLLLLLLLLAMAVMLQADIMDAPDALAHITALMRSEQTPMRQAAATCLGNLTEHQTRLGTTQVSTLPQRMV